MKCDICGKKAKFLKNEYCSSLTFVHYVVEIYECCGIRIRAYGDKILGKERFNDEM